MNNINNQFSKKLRKNRKEKRIEATELNKPILNCIGSFGYWFPSKWTWHERVQHISKKLHSSVDYLHKSIMYDID